MPSPARSAAVAVVALIVAGCAVAAAPTAPAAPPTSSPAASAAPANTPVVVTMPPVTPGPSFAPSEPPSTARPVLQAGESWLVYRWYPSSLFLVRPDGSDRHQLALDAAGTPLFPSWSPDGERIAFVMRQDDDSSTDTIWTANADGTDARHFYGGDDTCGDGADYPVWSPDGTRMALVCYSIVDDSGVSAVSVLDLATMERTDVAQFAWPEFTDNPPSWSPDGSRLAFDIITWDPTDTFVAGQELATVPAAGGEVTRITKPDLFAAHPDWSPDGTLLAFNTYDTGNMHGIPNPSNVWTIKPDGTNLRQLSTASTDGKMRLGQPFWSTDGSRIWVSVGRDWEKDSTGQFMNTLGAVDATTGAFTEIGTEGKSFVERPATGG